MLKLNLRYNVRECQQSTKLVVSEEFLINECLKKGEIEKRDANIYKHVYTHSSCIIIIYKNDSIDKTLFEELNLYMEGLKFDDQVN